MITQKISVENVTQYSIIFMFYDSVHISWKCRNATRNWSIFQSVYLPEKLAITIYLFLSMFFVFQISCNTVESGPITFVFNHNDDSRSMLSVSKKESLFFKVLVKRCRMRFGKYNVWH